MSTYALVENGAVTYIGDIPAKFKNITGFDKIQNDVVYKTHGFLPYTYTQGAFNPLTQVLGDTVFTIGANTVTGVRQILSKAQADIDSQGSAMYTQATAALKEILFATDWVHTPDSGLTVDQLATYFAMRASINNVITNAKGQAVTVDKLYAFQTTIQANLNNLRDRNPVMPAGLITLKTVLDALV